MRILIILTLLVLLTACTGISLEKDRITTKENVTKENSTLIKSIQEKIPNLETSLDTPSIIEGRIIDETESVDFGDVI
ncbi:MAG: hypothetical protein AABW88_04930 [Nanoarchaeota archaeon]